MDEDSPTEIASREIAHYRNIPPVIGLLLRRHWSGGTRKA